MTIKTPTLIFNFVFISFVIIQFNFTYFTLCSLRYIFRRLYNKSNEHSISQVERGKTFIRYWTVLLAFLFSWFFFISPPMFYFFLFPTIIFQLLLFYFCIHSLTHTHTYKTKQKEGKKNTNPQSNNLLKIYVHHSKNEKRRGHVANFYPHLLISLTKLIIC